MALFPDLKKGETLLLFPQQRCLFLGKLINIWNVTEHGLSMWTIKNCCYCTVLLLLHPQSPLCTNAVLRADTEKTEQDTYLTSKAKAPSGQGMGRQENIHSGWVPWKEMHEGMSCRTLRKSHKLSLGEGLVRHSTCLLQNLPSQPLHTSLWTGKQPAYLASYSFWGKTEKSVIDDPFQLSVRKISSLWQWVSCHLIHTLVCMCDYFSPGSEVISFVLYWK